VQQALEAVARASKGFSLHLVTRARPALADLLSGPLRAAIAIPQARAAPAVPPLLACTLPVLLPKCWLLPCACWQSMAT
jgi:hypothetical protein